ncbi:MAG: hypothetical protein Q9227_000200 [Pyrenula ochraceoflavens]
MGLADFPIEVLKSLKSASVEIKQEHERKKSSSPSSGVTSPINRSSTDISKPSTSSELHRLGSETSVGGDELSKQDSDQSLKPPGLDKAPTDPETRPSRQSTGGSLANALREQGRRLSRSGSRHGSRHASPARTPTSGGNSHHRTGSFQGENASHLTMESALSAAASSGRVVNAALKSPMDFTMSIAKGFHNAPKLYGDDTVRPSGKITGVQSGFKEAGKEFGYGLYDGITGLVTQPLHGAKKEGAAGLFKGAAKGIGGFLLKPSAAFWAIPGYTSKGIFAELQKHFGSSVQNYIIAARTAQGYEEWKNSTPEERTSVIAAWKLVKDDLHRQGRKYGKEKSADPEPEVVSPEEFPEEEIPHGFAQTRHLSWDERKALAEKRQRKKKEEKKRKKTEREQSQPISRSSSCQHCPFHHEPGFHHSIAVPQSMRTSTEGSLPTGFEDAIQRSVTATSKGNPDEDQMIEKAIRASVQELQDAHQRGTGEDEAYERAVAASIAEANRVRRKSIPVNDHTEQPKGNENVEVKEVAEDEDDDTHNHELAEALRRSLLEHNIKSSSAQQFQNHKQNDEDAIHDWSSDSGLGTEDDEGYQTAIRASQAIHKTNSTNSLPPPLPDRSARAPLLDKETQPELSDPQRFVLTPTEAGNVRQQHDIELERAIKESEEHAAQERGPHHDAELEQAIKESEEHHGKEQQEKEKQKTEEEIVMEYVKKQSLAEEEHRRRKVEGAQKTEGSATKEEPDSNTTIQDDGHKAEEKSSSYE